MGIRLCCICGTTMSTATAVRYTAYWSEWLVFDTKPIPQIALIHCEFGRLCWVGLGEPSRIEYPRPRRAQRAGLKKPPVFKVCTTVWGNAPIVTVSAPPGILIRGAASALMCLTRRRRRRWRRQHLLDPQSMLTRVRPRPRLSPPLRVLPPL